MKLLIILALLLAAPLHGEKSPGFRPPAARRGHNERPGATAPTTLLHAKHPLLARQGGSPARGAARRAPCAARVLRCQPAPSQALGNACRPGKPRP